MKVFFWHSVVSMHLQNTYNHLHTLMPSQELHLIVKESLSSDRLEQGWEVPPVIGMSLHVAPTHKQSLDMVGESGNIHIFEGISSGVWGDYIQPAKSNQNEVIVMSEMPDLRGVKSLLRCILSHFYERKYSKNIDYVMYIGESTKHWYLYCGFPPTHLIPFIYTVAPPSLTPYSKKQAGTPINNEGLHGETLDIYRAQEASQPFKIVFIGRLIKRKGVDLLLKSLCAIQSLWVLEIIGDGPELRNLEAIVRSKTLSSKVRFRGTLANTATRGIIEQYDLLVLPSYHDGWGCVVNEALMAGTPVLCSSNCGAADLLAKNSCLGSVFESRDLNSLTTHLRYAIQKGKPTSRQRLDIQMWANNIDSATVANYLAHFLLTHNKKQWEIPLTPPWATPKLHNN